MLVERHHIKGTKEIKRLCSTSKELYNRCNYVMRQAWFNKQRLPDIGMLINAVQNELCFKELHNTKTAKQTVWQVLTDWSNYKKATNAYFKDKSKFVRKPKPPHYKEKMAQVIFYNETIKRKPARNGELIPTNDLFRIKSDKPFKQVVITVTFDDIGGLDDVKRELYEAAQVPILYADLYRSYNRRPPKGWRTVAKNLQNITGT